MKPVLTFFFKKHFTRYDLICFTTVLLLFELSPMGWYTLLLLIPAIFVGVWGESKLENVKEMK